jgi:branched-chain amino acid transport system substrate-binding protein
MKGRIARRRLAAAGIAVGLAVGVAACGGSSSSGGSSAAVPSNGPIVFGQTVPQSGPAADYGESTAGIQAYFDTVNASGGVNGHQLKLTALDDQYQPPVAVLQTKKLINQGVLAEVGINGSADIKAVLPDLAKAGIPVIGPQSGAGFLFETATPSNVFTVWPEYTVDGEALANYALKLGLKKVGVLYQNDSFGETYLKGIAAAGLKPALEIGYDPTQTDFSSTAEHFKSAGVDGIIIAAIPKPTIAFLNALADINFKPVRLLSHVAVTPGSWKAASRELPGSYVGAFIPPLSSSSSDPQVSAFEQAMAKYQPSVPTSVFAAWGWMEAQVAVAGLKNVSGQITPSSYMKGLEAVQNLDTLGGSLSYGPSQHHGLTKMFIVQAENGAFVPAS